MPAPPQFYYADSSKAIAEAYGMCADPSDWYTADLPRKLESLLESNRRQAASNQRIKGLIDQGKIIVPEAVIS